MYTNTIEEQLYLLDSGVSFEYTDSIDAITRKDLLQFMGAWREKHPKTPLF